MTEEKIAYACCGFMHFESLDKTVAFFENVVEKLKECIVADVFYRQQIERDITESAGAIYPVMIKFENDFLSSVESLRNVDSSLGVSWEVKKSCPKNVSE